MTTCPNGHTSEEPDYCSVCGTSMTPASATVPTATADPAAAGAPQGAPCPSCGTPRAQPDARYCEVCRYDFESRTPGPPPVAADPPAAPAAAATPPAVASPPAAASPPGGPAGPGPSTPAEWEVTISVDSSLDVDPEPGTTPPTDAGERIFPIDLPEMLVGRRDDRHDIRPEIPVLDPAVSRRHAKLFRLPGGGLAVVDLASANGTAVNGAEIAAGERHELADGDSVTMGRWTRLAVRRR